MEMIVEDTVFFADPRTFNDPLDTKPTLELDLDIDELKHVLSQLVEARISLEMADAARRLKFQGSSTRNHIIKQSKSAAYRVISDAQYYANDPLYDEERFSHGEREKFIIGTYVEQELIKRYNKGIFCLAKRPNCPLMWSHYGDQHKGICIGYSVPNESLNDIHKVNYGGSRIVKASSILRMLENNDTARLEVDRDVLLKKAKPWNYEKEWRLLGEMGSQPSPLELEEIVFGMRCPPSVIFTVVKALTDRERNVRFYQIQGQHGRFLLDKRAADIDELIATHPRRHRGIFEAFAEIDDEVD
ncbi:DUF2971 domain-containing protein [Brevundimonas sp. GN22]